MNTPKTITQFGSLINDDCFNGISSIEDCSVDCILCDPPYNTTNCDWDCPLDLSELWISYKRILKPSGVVLLFGSEPFSSKVRLSNLSWYKYDLYWVKEKPVNFFQLKKRFGKTTENIMVFYKSQPTYNPQMTAFTGPKVSNATQKTHTSVTTGIHAQKITPYNDTGFRYPTDVLRINREKLGSTIHETQKPTELIELLLKSFTNENDLVLDTFAGSATTCICCEKLKRRYIAFEINPDIFSRASTRLTEFSKKNNPLF